MDSLSMTRPNSCQDYEALSLGQILRIPVLQQQLRTLDSSWLSPGENFGSECSTNSLRKTPKML